MQEKSLYDRLGGVFAIAAVVDKFSDAVVKNSIAGQDSESVNILTGEAMLLTEAALAELAAVTGAHPTPLDVTCDLPRVPTRPAFALQLSVLVLARMLVSHTPTAPPRVANTLAAHLRAIAAVPVS